MKTLGRYDIVGEIGRGACGVVYRATDPRIRRDVAIKTIPTHELRDFAGGKQLYDRLWREAQSAGILNHPGIVTVYELDEAENLTYIVMEFVDGQTVREIAAAPGGLTRSKAIDIISQTAVALDFAHKKGIIHRDVKPANIMVDSAGTVKITDFGVAKMVQAAGTTQTGVAVGTPHYMSPEQIYAKAVDGRADQFSLAVIAFELLAGRKPFEADSLPAIIHQILNVERPSEEDLAELGSGIGRVLAKGLAKKADDRFETCFDFAHALRRAVENRADITSTVAIPAMPAPEPTPAGPTVESRLRLPMIAALTFALAGAAFLGYRISTANRSSQPQPTAVQTADAAKPVEATPPPQPVPERPKAEVRKPEPAKPSAAKAEAPKPAPARPEPVAEAKPAPVKEQELPAVAAVPPGEYHGPPEGRFSWSGSLAPGQSLAIAGSRARFGAIAGRGLPPGVRVTATVSPGDLKILEQPGPSNGFRLVISNPTEREIASLSISWETAR